MIFFRLLSQRFNGFFFACCRIRRTWHNFQSLIITYYCFFIFLHIVKSVSFVDPQTVGFCLPSSTAFFEVFQAFIVTTYCFFIIALFIIHFANIAPCLAVFRIVFQSFIVTFFCFFIIFHFYITFTLICPQTVSYTGSASGTLNFFFITEFFQSFIIT